MYRIISIRDETQPFIDEAIGGEECLRVTAANWQRDLDNSGIRIASCGNDALAQINNATENFQSYIAEQSLVAFGAQNFILDVLSEVCRKSIWSFQISLRNAFTLQVNSITDLTNISPFVYSSVVEIYEPFHFEAIPEFERLLQVFVDLKDTVPIEISECVTATTSRLEDEAWVLRNTLEFCWTRFGLAVGFKFFTKSLFKAPFKV